MIYFSISSTIWVRILKKNIKLMNGYYIFICLVLSVNFEGNGAGLGIRNTLCPEEICPVFVWTQPHAEGGE